MYPSHLSAESSQRKTFSTQCYASVAIPSFPSSSSQLFFLPSPPPLNSSHPSSLPLSTSLPSSPPSFISLTSSLPHLLHSTLLQYHLVLPHSQVSFPRGGLGMRLVSLCNCSTVSGEFTQEGGGAVNCARHSLAVQLRLGQPPCAADGYPHEG